MTDARTITLRPEAMGAPSPAARSVRLAAEVLMSNPLPVVVTPQTGHLRYTGHTAPDAQAVTLRLEVMSVATSAAQLHKLAVEVMMSTNSAPPIVLGELSGNISVSPPESSHESDWDVAVYDPTTTDKVTSAQVSGVSYSVGDMSMDSSYYVLGLPRLGTVWGPNKTVQVGDKCFPTTPEAIPYIFKATAVTGVAGNTEPSWPTGHLQTVVDGGITWTNIGPMLRPTAIGPMYAIQP